MEKVIGKLLGGEVVFRIEMPGMEEREEARVGYAQKFYDEMWDKYWTMPTKEEIRKELLGR